MLLKSRSGLRAFLEEQPEAADGWRLLSMAEECLLNYPAAEQALNKALELSLNRDKRDLKRLALLREYKAKWKALVLQPNDLVELGHYLEAQLADTPCDHSLRLTAEWLRRRGLSGTSAIQNGLRSQGGYSDCEVLANVVH